MTHRPRFVYFLTNAERSFIKIGTTTNPRSRLGGMHMSAFEAIGIWPHTTRFRYMHITAGTIEDERHLLERFRHLRIPTTNRQREWFRFDPELVNHIRIARRLARAKARGHRCEEE